MDPGSADEWAFRHRFPLQRAVKKLTDREERCKGKVKIFAFCRFAVVAPYPISLADAFSRQGDWPRALAACDDALRRQPIAAAIWEARGKALLGLQRYTDAMTAFSRAAVLDPSLTSAQNNLGVAAAQSG